MITAQTLLQNNDAALIDIEAYKGSFGFAIGAMDIEERSYFIEHHMLQLFSSDDFENGGQGISVVSLQQLIESVGYIYNHISQSDYVFMSRYFNLVATLVQECE